MSNLDVCYLERALVFLKKYQWIFNFRNTDVLTKDVLANLPKDWAEYFNGINVDNLHGLVKGNLEDSAPLDFKYLIDEINELNCKQTCETVESVESVSYKCTGLTQKKVHEITLLAPVINEICQETKCDLIVDIGSGFGHLPHMLFEKYHYPVLALEVSNKLIQTALENQTKLKPASKGHVIFKEVFVNKSSAGCIEELVEENFGPDKKICLTGLHACADLSVEVLKLFSRISKASALVIMPCCYHRMNTDFKNFPASSLGKKLFDKYQAYGFTGEAFLRLACQQTSGTFIRMSKEEHEKHAQQCMHRAVLQLVAEMENCTLRRLKRKSGKSNALDIDVGFQDYLNNLETTHQLVGRDPNKRIKVTDETFRRKMYEKWTEHKNECWQVEVLMGLQAAIQGICENVVLLDRVEFLKEKGIRCYNRKITNDCISPRCWALIAMKSFPS
ncbi:unnamed protein product [Ceutorhynchus assimilis]|uniref:Methyltransferase domain-containing protein n=1 Tax=Ceutorhynchus assimilis TaxID=467358 RepID=A0A9N9MLX2_9CUCU|nr:unnamed protein product [Ceutorhynchus assimilis]